MRAFLAHNGPAMKDPVEVINPSGAGDFILVCEHASNYIPPELAKLGLDEDLLTSHIAWDPGALAVAQSMAAKLDAPLIAPGISRLVYDCNRAPGLSACVPALSEHHEIPGNSGLSKASRRMRADQYYTPFVNALRESIAVRMERKTRPAVITIHSFTPVFKGVMRDVDIGLLHDKDARFAETMLALGQEQTGLVFGLNTPYGPEDGVTHTLKEHAIKHGLLNVMIEVRNDLIEDEAAQGAMAVMLAGLAVTVFETLTGNFR